MALQDWINEISFYDEGVSEKKRALLYGPTGAGKTRFSSTWPNPFFVDTDKGGLSLRKLHVPYVPISYGSKAGTVIRDILDKLEKGEDPFDKMNIETVVFDSFTSLADMLLHESMLFPSSPGKIKRDPVNNKPEWDDYQAVRSRLHDIVLRCKDLKLNVVAICGEKLERDEVLGTFIGKPNIVGSYRDLIGYDFDEVYYMETEGQGEKMKYNLHTQKFKYYDAKSRLDLKGKVEDPSFDKLYKSLKEEG